MGAASTVPRRLDSVVERNIWSTSEGFYNAVNKALSAAIESKAITQENTKDVTGKLLAAFSDSCNKSGEDDFSKIFGAAIEGQPVADAAIIDAAAALSSAMQAALKDFMDQNMEKEEAVTKRNLLMDDFVSAFDEAGESGFLEIFKNKVASRLKPAETEAEKKIWSTSEAFYNTFNKAMGAAMESKAITEEKAKDASGELLTAFSTSCNKSGEDDFSKIFGAAIEGHPAAKEAAVIDAAAAFSSAIQAALEAMKKEGIDEKEAVAKGDFLLVDFTSACSEAGEADFLEIFKGKVASRK